MSSEGIGHLSSDNSAETSAVQPSPQTSSFSSDSGSLSTMPSHLGASHSEANSSNSQLSSNNGSDVAVHVTTANRNGAVPAPPEPRNNVPGQQAVQQQHPLYYVRDQLFHALFQRLALTYARAVPPHGRMALEWLAFVKVIIIITVHRFPIIGI